MVCISLVFSVFLTSDTSESSTRDGDAALRHSPGYLPGYDAYLFVFCAALLVLELAEGWL